jgi:hypothetical protein
MAKITDKTTINSILTEINKKKEELFKAYDQLRKEYGFSIEKRRIVFNPKSKAHNKSLKKSWVDSVFSVQLREFLSIPFIYAVFVPIVLMDCVFFIYQQTASRLYKIPLVRRRDYIVYDRKYLDYLNWIQKFNCIYCSYVN